MARTTTRDKGISLARFPALVLGSLLLAFGLLAFLKNGDNPTGGFPDGTVNGSNFLGFEVNGWTAFFTAVAGGLLMFGAAQHLLAKTMSLLVGLALGACSVIALVDGKDVLGLAAANGWTKLGWGAAAAFLLINTLLPRKGGRKRDDDLDDEVVERPVARRQEPVATEPVRSAPVATEPVRTERVATEPVRTERVATEPVRTERVGDDVRTERVDTERVSTDRFGDDGVRDTHRIGDDRVRDTDRFGDDGVRDTNRIGDDGVRDSSRFGDDQIRDTDRFGDDGITRNDAGLRDGRGDDQAGLGRSDGGSISEARDERR